MEARSDAVKCNIAKEPQCWVHESRQIGIGQKEMAKSEHRPFRNQQTKID